MRAKLKIQKKQSNSLGLGLEAPVKKSFSLGFQNFSQDTSQIFTQNHGKEEGEGQKYGEKELS